MTRCRIRRLDPDATAVHQDEFRRTLEALHGLPEIDRTVLLLRAEQELSYEDIAAATGLSVAAASEPEAHSFSRKPIRLRLLAMTRMTTEQSVERAMAEGRVTARLP